MMQLAAIPASAVVAPAATQSGLERSKIESAALCPIGWSLLTLVGDTMSIFRPTVVDGGKSWMRNQDRRDQSTMLAV